jgi:hypothetical protein
MALKPRRQNSSVRDELCRSSWILKRTGSTNKADLLEAQAYTMKQENKTKERTRIQGI